MADILAYWWRVTRGAVFNTVQFFGDHWLRSVVVAAICIGIGSIIHFGLQGKEPMLDELYLWATHVFAPFGVICACVFMSSLFVVPARLFLSSDRETENLRQTITSRLDDMTAMRAQINRSTAVTDEIVRAQKCLWFAEFFFYLATKNLGIPKTSTLSDLEDALRRAEEEQIAAYSAAEKNGMIGTWESNFYLNWIRTGDDALDIRFFWATEEDRKELLQRYQALTRVESGRMETRGNDVEIRQRFLRLRAGRIAAWRFATELKSKSTIDITKIAR